MHLNSLCEAMHHVAHEFSFAVRNLIQFSTNYSGKAVIKHVLLTSLSAQL